MYCFMIVYYSEFCFALAWHCTPRKTIVQYYHPNNLGDRQMKTLITSILLMTCCSSVMAAQNDIARKTSKGLAVVSKATCKTLKHSKEPFILVLDSGDNLKESISSCAEDAKLMGASVSGLGQLHNPVLAYFTSNPKDKPTLQRFDGYYELASINGNVSKNGNRYYTHVHGILADKQFHGIAGHIDSANIGQTVEITLVPFTHDVARVVDANTGFGELIH